MLPYNSYVCNYAVAVIALLHHNGERFNLDLPEGSN